MKKTGVFLIFFTLVLMVHLFVFGDDEDASGMDAEYYTDSNGGTMENLGGGQFLDSDGTIMQAEDLGGGEYMTDDGDIIEGDGEGEYMSGDGESFRDMD